MSVDENRNCGCGFNNNMSSNMENNMNVNMPETLNYSNSCQETQNTVDCCMQQEMLNQIMAYDFAINDLALYLDTHTDDEKALCLHRKYCKEYRELTGETAQGTPNIVVDEKNNNTGRNIGDIVQINGVYTSSSSTKKLTPTTKSGMITRIIPGAKNPYLLNNGNIGWVNDSCIISSGSSQAQDNNTNATPNISVGSTVTLSASATNYATGQKIPNSFKNRNYTIMQVGNGKVLLKELYSWVYTKDLVGYTTSSVNSVSNSNFVLGLYVVNTTSGLNVRSGPGTNYEIKKTYANGTRFDTYEVKGDWARTPSGWVNLKYCKLVRKY